MSSEIKCGDCVHFIPDKQTSPENGGVCLYLLLKEVYPNHTPFYTLESHALIREALSLLTNPNDTCFIKRPVKDKKLVDLSSTGILSEYTILTEPSLN